MATGDTQYGMSMDMPVGKSHHKSRRHRRGNSNHSEDADPSDGSASLTYSAGSSIASSAAGESTDSSFADIMRVLDEQETKELAAYMKREGVTDPAQAYARKTKSTAVSVTSSLNYSTDGESALMGTDFLQTITGQPSDSGGPDGGGGFPGFDTNIAFAAADEPVKRKGSRKDRSSKNKSKSSPKSSSRHSSKRSKSSSTSSRASSSNNNKESPSTPPPPVPRSRSNTEQHGFEGCDDEDEVWYAKWWMCGFADSFRDLVPKR